MIDDNHNGKLSRGNKTRELEALKKYGAGTSSDGFAFKYAPHPLVEFGAKLGLDETKLQVEFEDGDGDPTNNPTFGFSFSPKQALKKLYQLIKSIFSRGDSDKKVVTPHVEVGEVEEQFAPAEFFTPDGRLVTHEELMAEKAKEKESAHDEVGKPVEVAIQKGHVEPVHTEPHDWALESIVYDEHDGGKKENLVAVAASSVESAGPWLWPHNPVEEVEERIAKSEDDLHYHPPITDILLEDVHTEPLAANNYLYSPIPSSVMKELEKYAEPGELEEIMQCFKVLGENKNGDMVECMQGENL